VGGIGAIIVTQITIKRLWKEYETQIVLENVNLHVGDHEFVTIVGASGCGKTTFLRMLLGVESPSRGEFLIDGQPLSQEPGPDRGIVFQRYSLFPHLTVLENLLLGLDFRGSRFLGRLHGARRRDAIAKADHLLDAVGLMPSRGKYPAQLSGGMQQRLSIAQSVICEPKILLLDEPFGALDPGITSDMHELILKLWNMNKMTIFMVTHDLKESFYLGTRLLVFDKTRIDNQAPERYGATITYDIPLKGRRRSFQRLGGESGASRDSDGPADALIKSPSESTISEHEF
jgi:NitT/TauT family transport system ATP-binding protein